MIVIIIFNVIMMTKKLLTDMIQENEMFVFGFSHRQWILHPSIKTSFCLIIIFIIWIVILS